MAFFDFRDKSTENNVNISVGHVGQLMIYEVLDEKNVNTSWVHIIIAPGAWDMVKKIDSIAMTDAMAVKNYTAMFGK